MSEELKTAEEPKTEEKMNVAEEPKTEEKMNVAEEPNTAEEMHTEETGSEAKEEKSEKCEKQGKKHFDRKNFLTRVLAGAVLLLILFGADYLGGWWFFGVFALISGLSLWEFYHAFGIEKEPAGLSGYMLGAGFYVLLGLGYDQVFFPFIIGSFLILMILYVLNFKETDCKAAMASFTGLLYTVVMTSYAVRVRSLEGGAILFILLLTASWGNDSFAYLSGSAFGKHKMAKVLSPKKSWEGFVGGIFGAFFLGILVGLLFENRLTAFENPILSMGIMSGVLAFFAVIGDLLASAFKRNLELKDYSHVIPGHGGMLDRFDSVIFAAPVLYFMVMCFFR